MIDVEVSTRVGRGIDDVWRFVTDPANRSRWDASVVSEEMTSPGPLAAGSTLHTRMRVLGRDAEFDWSAVEVSPPSTLAVRSTAGPLATDFRLDLVAAGTGTAVTASLLAEPEGLMRLIEPMIEQAIRRDLTAALARLKDILEA